MHPRNRHQGRYDFSALVAARSELAAFVAPNPYGDLSIDFANPEAVKSLNRALLASYYGLRYWDIPPGFLCPPIPGRADHLHFAADLLAEFHGGKIPRGEGVRVLDIGVGANAIYPIVGRCEYGWRFTGSDVDATALDAARRIVEANPVLTGGVELRRQTSPEKIFAGVVNATERFDLTVCNPPFHTSAEEAVEGSRRKWRNLGKPHAKAKAPALNFGGRAAELWCPGGEEAFVRRMIRESAEFASRIGLFTSLVAKSEHLRASKPKRPAPASPISASSTWRRARKKAGSSRGRLSQGRASHRDSRSRISGPPGATVMRPGPNSEAADLFLCHARFVTP